MRSKLEFVAALVEESKGLKIFWGEKIGYSLRCFTNVILLLPFCENSSIKSTYVIVNKNTFVK
jgi:hypothetical protein